MITIPITSERTLREIVSENFASASVLEKYGLDFCCNGGTTLTEACSRKGLDVATIASELATVEADEASPRHIQWELPFLIDYIVNNHHAYVRAQIPLIGLHLSKVERAHGERHPEVYEVAEIFRSESEAFEDHMAKEEQILFPFMKVLYRAHRDGGQLQSPPFGSVAGPIGMMLDEHEQTGDAMARIRGLLADYTPPVDACTTMRLLYKELDAFERDLHKHVFLENAILFPKAIRLEEEAAQAPRMQS